MGKSHLQNMQDEPPMIKPPSYPDRVTVEGVETPNRDRRDGEAYEQELFSRWQNPAHRLRLPYYGFEHVELCMEHGDMAFGDYERWLKERLPEADMLRGPALANADDRVQVPQAWRTRIPEDLYPSSFIAERTVDYLKVHAAERRGQPFFLMCSFPDPHHPFTPPGRYWDMYDPQLVDLPATCGAPPDGAPPHLRWLHQERASGKANLNTPRVVAISSQEAREAIALTYGMVSMIDDQIGQVMHALEGSGLADNTIVIFTSDHGDFMGDHGLLFKGPLHYQSLVRVPFIWSEPGQPNPRRSAALHSTLDIAQSILERTGTAPYHD
ncbi:MAG: sulfatase, partial [Pseudomonadales bacterium]